ncbi:hypothetical protein [Streptomyces griseocarneus]|uniref:Uncharacterized protein n=1 Tax=Streptomyces griseocarneus TaxID=51201 RepID=A0ABX7RU73_9ACTN|nr:hypothetical protein [Streptomyces griseocarneus]QSY51582.1 hypothetical protein J3S04_12325 [Streptomyces griseocarneus]
MTSASISPDGSPAASPLAAALRAIKAFAGAAAVSVVVLGEYADKRTA